MNRLSERRKEILSEVTENQKKRANRSISVLKEHGVPIFEGPLYTDDDEEVILTSQVEVGKRAMVLWLLICRAIGRPLEDVLCLLDDLNLRRSLSLSEREFVGAKEPPEEKMHEIIWEYESLRVLLWAMCLFPFLGWPRQMCNKETILDMQDKMMNYEGMPEFCKNTTVRSKNELLDERDLMMRLYWAIRNAGVNNENIPENLEWHAHAKCIPPESSSVAKTVYYRYRTLNWLVSGINSAQWDEVDTPT